MIFLFVWFGDEVQVAEVKSAQKFHKISQLILGFDLGFLKYFYNRNQKMKILLPANWDVIFCPPFVDVARNAKVLVHENSIDIR